MRPGERVVLIARAKQGCKSIMPSTIRTDVQMPDWDPVLEFAPGPEPLDHAEPDPKFYRRPVGFAPPPVREPLLWEGDPA